MTSAPTAPETPKTPRTPRTPSKARRRALTIRRVRLARHLTQLAFAVFIIVAAVRHQQVENAASVDALCPMGAVETLLTWVTTGGLISKIHPSNLVLGLAIVISTILVGNAFCGWVCPFGALQDGIAWVRRTLHLPTVTVPPRADAVLRWGRFVVLAVVMWMSYTTAKLWFFDYDPYGTLFGLHWLFEFNPGMWPALTILGVVVIGAFLVERAFCRYLCPLGAVFAILNRFSIMRIRRSAPTCTDCKLCDKACPVGIEPALAKPFVSTDCVGCMDCLTTCPVKGALKLDAPVLLGFPVKADAVTAPSRKAGVR
jgi:ferredoxin